MNNTGSSSRAYLLAALLGAAGGGLVVALATKAIPRILSQVMPMMMQNVMANMAEGGCSPSEM